MGLRRVTQLDTLSADAAVVNQWRNTADARRKSEAKNHPLADYDQRARGAFLAIAFRFLLDRRKHERSNQSEPGQAERNPQHHPDFPPKHPVRLAARGERVCPLPVARYLPQRALAAFLAMDFRLVGLNAFAHALPPASPPRRMCFFTGSGFTSCTSPVAIRMTWTACPITSAGPFSPLGPRDINSPTCQP